MAKKIETVVTLTDDVDGGKADRTVSFSIDGINYEIDLSKKNANAFEKALQPYVASARKVRSATGRGRRNSTSRRVSTGPNSSEVREWATANGIEVSARGRVSQTVLDQFAAAH